MPRTYRDRWIECTPDAVRIRGYYIPWGTKHIPYVRIRSIRRVEMSVLTGRGRIWGTANPLYWANLDPQRPGKKIGLILDVGPRVRPFITPDDPEAVERVIHEHTGLRVVEEADGRSPIL